MATIKFVDGAHREFMTFEERVANDPTLAAVLDRVPPENRQGSTFSHHTGDDETPELFEIQMPPNFKVEAHAHDADEIIVVAEGEICFGKQVYGVGSSVFIPKMTLYSFESGPNGLRFLNFRPTGGSGFIPKDQLLAERGADSV